MIIRVRELSSDADDSFLAQVDFGSDGGARVRVSDPATPAQERLLAWYFEEHLRYPFLDKDMETEAVALVASYGETLFGQVFSGEAAFGYRQIRDGEHGFDGCRLVVEGSAGFHRLHWEALRDPGRGPLALRLPLTRRAGITPMLVKLPTGQAVMRILVVTARPDGPADVGYRTISRPLLDAVRQARLPIEVDLVRPGTWEALRDRLRAASLEHGVGRYQVVHFDLHGSFGTPAQVGAGAPPGRYVFEPGQDPSRDQGFLFFETATPGQAKPVAATQVAELLAEHRVAVVVLNACQSARQTGAEASLAQALAAAGAPVALGMAYSVTVSAAARVMPVFYGQLAAGTDPVTAAFVARQALHDVKARRGYFDQSLDLEDWMLPVVFGQRDPRLQLREMDQAEQAEFYLRLAEVSAEPLVEYGFVGRDLDIHHLERRLLTDSSRHQVLVQGMAGTGKSTLLAHVAWWWKRTGLVQQAFSFSYEQRAWTVDQITRQIATTLFDPVRFGQWEALPEAARTEQIATALRATRHLLILDNAESITAARAAIPHSLSDVEQRRLADLCSRLRGGQTLVLVGSREAETWLAPSAFSDNTYTLPGLDPQAASILLERILQRHGGRQYLAEGADPVQREALTELVELLGGFPLPMTVVLPQLATQTPQQVLAELRGGEDHADPVGLLRRAIEYSHGKLDPVIRRSLQLLAPFTGTLPPSFTFDWYEQALGEQEAVRALGAIDLPGALDELTRVGLSAPYPRMVTWTQVVPLLPYFLRNSLRDQPAVAEAAAQAHYLLYTKLAPVYLGILVDNDPQTRAGGRTVMAAEYANLTSAIDHGLRTGQLIGDIVIAVEEYLDQTQQHETRRRLVDHVIAAYHPAETPQQQRDVVTLHSLAGKTALGQARSDQARAHYEAALSILQELNQRPEQATIYHQLGRVAQLERRWEQAEQYYRHSIDIYAEFNDRRPTATAYRNLGSIAQELRRWEQAEQHYRRALDITLEIGDRHSAASTYHSLGMMAQELRRWGQAEQYFRQTLDIVLEFGDRRTAASTYQQLGIVMQEQQRFEQAEQYYRQTLDIVLDLGDQRGAAVAFHNLATVTLELRRLEQAEQYCLRALDVLLELGDRHSAASTYHQLGRVAQDLERWEQAEQYYRQAIDIKLEFGDTHSAARSYHQLGFVAQALERWDQAEQHYRQAIDIYQGFDDRHSAAPSHHNLGMVLQQLRRWEQAAQHYRQAIDIKLEFGEWRNAAATYQVLGEVMSERGRPDEAIQATLSIAALWHAETGQWPAHALDDLRAQRQDVPTETFERLVQQTIPAEARESLLRAATPSASTPERPLSES